MNTLTTKRSTIDIDFPRTEQHWQAAMSYAEGHVREFEQNEKCDCTACNGYGEQAALDDQHRVPCRECKGAGRQAVNVSALRLPPTLFNNEAFDIMRAAVERAATKVQEESHAQGMLAAFGEHGQG